MRLEMIIDVSFLADVLQIHKFRNCYAFEKEHDILLLMFKVSEKKLTTLINFNSILESKNHYEIII